MSQLNVTEEAAEACLLLTKQIEEEHAALSDLGLVLKRQYEDNQEGLGQHGESISDLIEQLNQNLRLNVGMAKATKKIRRAAALILEHIHGSFPISSASDTVTQPTQSQIYLAGVMSRLYEGGYRKMRTPQKNGQWRANTFFPDPNTCPTVYNPCNRTFGEIFANLEEKFKIKVKGIPYREGLADFSGIAVAKVSESDIINAYYPNMLSVLGAIDYQKVFENRERNFLIADHIAAERGLKIPGLDPGYSADDLREWRRKNFFTWEESPLYGYLLVPGEVHNNVPHTGLVGLETHGEDLG